MKSRNIALLVLAFMLLAAGCSSASRPNREFAFTWQDTEIAMHMPSQTLVTELGGPKYYSEKASHTFEGRDKTYTYSSFCLSTYPKEEKDLVYSVWLTDENAATEEGISIGATQAEVEAVYGSNCFRDTNACTLEGKTSRLIIILTEGIVSSIQYEAVLS